ncbi:Diphthamide synthase [uncultured archaeon]|nr:Diphthamide synthase [uncultured archaeon]
MQLGVLFSGGKDSTYAAWLAKKYGHEIACLISIVSKNPDSFMFHTPAIKLTQKQAELIDAPLVCVETLGKKEEELGDLKKAIKKAVKDFKIEGIVTGAVESVYQASRIQKICNELKIECFNPLWQKNQIELLNELVKSGFEIIISGVAAYPFDKSWIGRKIDKKFIEEVSKLQEKYKINPAGEGGEFESLVVNCPLFKKRLELGKFEVVGEGNSWRIDLK